MSRSPVSGIEQDGQPDQKDRAQERLSRYFDDYAAEDHPGLRYVLRHPVSSAGALAALAGLPELSMRLGPGAEGAAIRSALSRTSGFGRIAIIRGATDLLRVPATAEEYELGAAKQTLRRQVRGAHKLGVDWRTVDTPDERRELLRLADDQERAHPLEEYRRVAPDNADLLEYRLWLAAYARDGRPLLLSVTPTDGEWALLRYFRTLGDGPEYSAARYLVTRALVGCLAEAGVRYLVNGDIPFILPKGLRHFQRMVGWQVGRVRVAPATRA
jgi:hypothetical protein